MKVTVAVLTFRRGEYLEPLVGDLEREVALTSGRADSIRVLVVDNDPVGSGQAVLAQLRPAVSLTCVVEPRPGIAAARNRALIECADDDVLVFLDDDERPDTGWLDALLATYEEHRPAAVSGPVRTIYLGEVDPWVVAGRFVDRSHRDGFQTGATVAEAATNNLLLDLATVRRLGLVFDESLRLSGGEDSLFTRMLTRAGGRIVWCADAWVSDLRPAERTTRRAALRRAYSFANVSVVVRIKLTGGGAAALPVRARAIAVGLARIAAGTASCVLGLVTSRVAWQANGARLVARGCGSLTAGAGVRHEEYALARAGGAASPASLVRQVFSSPR